MVAPAPSPWAVDPRTLPEDAAVSMHRGIAVQIAAQWRNLAASLVGYEPPFEEIESHALMGLLYSIRRFDPSHGCTFSTFAHATINGYMSRALKAWTRFGYKAYAGGKIAAVRAGLPRFISTSRVVADRGGTREMTLGDTLGAEDEEHRDAPPSYASMFEKLPPDERHVLTLRYGGLGLAQVARLVGMSSLDVRHIEARALVRMSGEDPDTVPPYDPAALAHRAKRRAYHRAYRSRVRRRLRERAEVA